MRLTSFALDEQKTFERMYGWAWLFRLAIDWMDGMTLMVVAGVRIFGLWNRYCSRVLRRICLCSLIRIRTGQHTTPDLRSGRFLTTLER